MDREKELAWYNSLKGDFEGDSDEIKINLDNRIKEKIKNFNKNQLIKLVLHCKNLIDLNTGTHNSYWNIINQIEKVENGGEEINGSRKYKK